MADQESSFKELPVISAGPLTQGPGQGDPILGIDLGTTNSLVAIVDRTQAAGADGRPRVIPSREGRNLIPSVVHFEKDGTARVGYVARDQRVHDAGHTVYSVKRLLGRGADDIAALRDRLSYNVAESSASNVRIQVEDKSYTPIEISAMILKELKLSAEEFLGRPVEDAVITVPAYFNDSQRQATRMAGRLAGFNVLRILNEPTAASLAYGLQKKRNGLIAVYDLGGGTFDISILRLKDGIFEVLSTNGDTQLGGDDMDHALADWIDAKLGGVRAPEDKAAILELAERAKIALSDSEAAKISTRLPSGMPVELEMSRAELRKIILPILERTRKPVEAALRDAGIAAKELTDAVLVGGPTRLPVLREYVAGLFGREPNASMHPDEVVALGAAIQADILAGNNTDLLLLDVVPLSLGIETFGGTMSKLIPRNTRIPTMAKEQFTTYLDGQTKVAINVYQGERELVKENRKLAEFVLSGIPPLPAGAARIEVTFLVDADGILDVSAKELYSEIEASIEVKPTYGLTDSEVERMLADGLEHAGEDLKVAQAITARNDAQKVIDATERALTQVKESLEPDEIAVIGRLVEELRACMKREDADAIKAAQKALDTGTVHLAEVLMSQTLEKDLRNQKVKDILK